MKYYETSSRKVCVTDEYDVIVCGGGPAGCAAAIASAKLGAKTALIEKNGYLGGATVAQLVCAVLSTNGVDFQGIWHDYANRLIQYGGLTGIHKAPNPYYPDFNWLRGRIDPEQVKCVWQELVLDSGVDLFLYGTIIDVLKEDHTLIGIELFCRGQRQAILGKRIIDATGNADVAFMAGCEWQRGSEPSIYTQEVSLVYRVAVPSDQTNSGKSPEGLARKDCKQADTLSIKDLTRATVEMRKEIFKESSQAELIATAEEIGVRSSRIITGIKTVRNDDAWNLKKDRFSIAKSSWELDIHPIDSNPVDPHLFHSKSDIYAERLNKIASGDWFDIPYGAIVAKDVGNLLLAGRIVSTELFAHGSLRIQQTCMATGEAAGVAAALSVDNTVAPETMSPEDVIARLTELRSSIKPVEIGKLYRQE